VNDTAHALSASRTLWDLVARRADLTPDRPVLLQDDRSLSFGELRARAERVAAGLYDMGVRPGTVVAWQLPTRIKYSNIKLSRPIGPDSEKLTKWIVKVLNGLKPAEAKVFHDEFGDVNIYMRTVMHVFQHEDKPTLAETLSVLLGERGTLYQIELSLCALDYFRTLPGDSPSGLPRCVHNVIRTGATSVGFDPALRPMVYPDAKWQVIAQGDDVTINTVPLGRYGTRAPMSWPSVAAALPGEPAASLKPA